MNNQLILQLAEHPFTKSGLFNNPFFKDKLTKNKEKYLANLISPDAKHTKTTTGNEQLGKWYSNTGGVNNAIERAQNYRNSLDKTAPKEFYPSLNKKDWENPVYVFQDPSLKNDGYLGWFTPAAPNSYFMDPKYLGSEVEDEEITHLLQNKARQPKNVNRYTTSEIVNPNNGKMDDESIYDYLRRENHRNYFSKPNEQGARLSLVKRYYEMNTGQQVNTPEDAKKAYEYFWQRHKMYQLQKDLRQKNKNNSLDYQIKLWDWIYGKPTFKFNEENKIFRPLRKYWKQMYDNPNAFKLMPGLVQDSENNNMRGFLENNNMPGLAKLFT